MLLLSEKWAPVLVSQPETGMGYQIVTVVLSDGRKFAGVTIAGGYVTKVGAQTEIPFRDEDIAEIIVDHGRGLPNTPGLDS